MAKWRRVQKAESEFGAVIYLAGPGVDADHDGIGDLDEALCAALPGVGIVATVESGYGAVPGDLASALATSGARELGLLAGFSGGCQGVRAHLWRGAKPRAAVMLDGTSARFPEPDPPQIDVWRQLAAEARRGERVAVFTCTAQRYTENPRLPGGPFAATSKVLARALDWPEAGTYPTSARPLAVYPAEPVLQRHDGGLHAYAYPGTDCDAAAHVAQLVHVLPWVLTEHVRPALDIAANAGAGLPSVSEGLSSLGAWLANVGQHVAERLLDSPRSAELLGARHLARMLGKLGEKEIPGAALSNPWIDECLALCVRGGKVLGLRGDSEFSWCAASASWAGLPPGMVPRAAVAELVADARKLGLWRDSSVWRDPQAGDLAVYTRTVNGVVRDPRTGGEGHVNRCIQQTGNGRAQFVGGNEADAVRISERALTEPVGYIVYPR